jgi:cytochrome c peroxidase
MNKRCWMVVVLIVSGLAAAARAGGEISPAALARLSPEARTALQEARISSMHGLSVPGSSRDTPALLELGRLLYFDPRLSADGTLSCATCHDPKIGWAETDKTSVGIRGQVGPRNAPTVLNSAYYHALFWDGRAASLEEQALGPIQNPKEMGNTLEAVVATVGKIAGYKDYFTAAFGDGTVTAERIAKAIAAFERTVVSGPSPFDEFLGGSTSALSDRQVRGLELFLTKGGCTACHTGPFLTEQDYAPAGIHGDEGRYKVTGQAADKEAFRVPTLRDVDRTAPYFHDGSAPTLEDAVFFRANGITREAMKGSAGADLTITEAEAADIAAFLRSLNGRLPRVEVPVKLPE